LLLIAGEGPARASLLRLAHELGVADSLRMVGNLDREHGLNDCYAAANAFVFASRTETQGLVLLEAMAQGRAVVSTACLGTRSVLTEKSGARVVEEDEATFAHAVSQVLGDRELAAGMGERGLQWARQWSSLALARRMAALYQALTPAPSRLAATAANR
jgi:1,2-diacylglycerol 3-alpha-glucosyltransferase